MERLCSTIFLLLVVAASISNTLQLNIQLEPKYINVCEGESVTIKCTFQPAGKYNVKWFYRQTPDFDCNSATDTIQEKWHISTVNNDTWSILNFTSIETNDSGWYFCKVTKDIPVLLHFCSDGTQVQVASVKAFQCQWEQPNVYLEPKYIEVWEGESVTINCTFQPAGKYKVKWVYRQTPDLDCNSATDTIQEKWHISTLNNDTWSTLNFTSIETNDSGWYFCKVTIDIPVLLHICSDGTQVLVTSTYERITACVLN